MTDKISNGDFFVPNILGFQGEVGGIQYYDTFSEGQKDIFIWVGSDGDLSVENNDNGMTSSGYPDISLLNIQGASGLNLYQYASFQNTACLYQSFNLTKIGVYNLSFLYVSRPNFVLNNLQIFLNDLLLDVISTPQTSWTEYTLSFPVSTTGSYTLFFQGQPDITDANIAITNIKLIEPPSIIGGGITVYNNNFKSTNIYGYLNLVTISSRAIGQITTNFLTCKKNLTMPANGTNSIYYKDISNNNIGRLFGSQLQMYFGLL